LFFCQYVLNKNISSIIDFFWLMTNITTRSSLKSIEITIEKHERIIKALFDHDYEKFHQAMIYHYTYEYLKK